ncbi:MAG TPA: hypothetical protein V6D08_02185 [Candidatus Obscuribacterales bacterium]
MDKNHKKTRERSKSPKNQRRLPATAHIKFAVSMPQADFAKIEELRRGLKMARSKLILAAIRHWFAEAERQIAVAEYVRGYETFPEDAELLKVMESVQSNILPEDRW